MRSTTFSPKAVGMVRDAQLDLAAALVALDAAVLRPALLGEVRAATAA